MLQLVKALFHLELDPVAERLDQGCVLYTFSFLQSDPLTGLVIQPVLVEVECNVKFNGIVASCDRLDVPLYIVVLLHLLDVVDVVEDEQRDKDSHTSQEERVFLADHDLVLCKGAGDLNVDQAGVSVALLIVESLCSLVDVSSEVLNLADLLAHALFLNIIHELVSFQEAGTIGRVGETVS